MKREHRQEERFEENGRVEAPEACAFPGVLGDISLSGCKVRFPVGVELDAGTEYTLSITMPRKQAQSTLRLICRPQWFRESGTGCEVGFRTLRSPDTPLLADYVRQLRNETQVQPETHTVVGLLMFSTSAAFR